MKVRFDSITPKLNAQRQHVHELCRQYARSPSKGNLKRLKQLFSLVGEQVVIEAGFTCDYGDSIRLGARVFINSNCTMLDNPSSTDTSIIIGDDCLIGPNVQLLAVTHDTDPKLRLAHKYNYADNITLDNNVWLGAGVIVLAGISIGANTVVGAGSVVTQHLDKNSVYVGNPARKIRSL